MFKTHATDKSFHNTNIFELLNFPVGMGWHKFNWLRFFVLSWRGQIQQAVRLQLRTRVGLKSFKYINLLKCIKHSNNLNYCVKVSVIFTIKQFVIFLIKNIAAMSLAQIHTQLDVHRAITMEWILRKTIQACAKPNQTTTVTIIMNLSRRTIYLELSSHRHLMCHILPTNPTIHNSILRKRLARALAREMMYRLQSIIKYKT